MELTLTSPVFEHNTRMDSKYTCDGKDVNPPLVIGNVPEGAKSLVLIMDDPDVPTHLREDGTWDHWVKFNIQPHVTIIEEGSEPEGVSGVGTSGNKEYHGPCPPDREHRYFFTVYALDTELVLKEGASKDEVKDAMKGHILDKAELIGLYERKQ